MSGVLELFSNISDSDNETRRDPHSQFFFRFKSAEFRVSQFLGVSEFLSKH